MVPKNHLDFQARTRRDLRGVRIEPCPLFIHAEIRIIPGNQRRYQVATLLEGVDHEIEMGWRKPEGGRDVVVEEQIVARQVADVAQTNEEALVGWEEVAVDQAVIVHAGRGEGISDEEDGLSAVMLRQQAAMIEGL